MSLVWVLTASVAELGCLGTLVTSDVEEPRISSACMVGLRQVAWNALNAKKDCFAR